MASKLADIDFSIYPSQRIDPIKKCFYDFKQKYCHKNNEKCINNIVKNMFLNSDHNMINIDGVLLPNIIFILYLIYLKKNYGDNQIDKLRPTSNTTSTINVNKNNKPKVDINVNKLFSTINTSLRPPWLVQNEIESLRSYKVRQTMVEEPMILSQMKLNALQTEDVSRNFIIWICNWQTYINNLYDDANNIYTNEIKKKQLKLNQNDQSFYDTMSQKLDTLNKNIAIFGNKYYFIIILGELLKKFKIKKQKLYESLDDKRKDIIKEINNFSKAYELSLPYGTNYTQFAPIMAQTDNCMINALNDIYYYLYLVNIQSNEEITIGKLLKKESKYKMMNFNDLNINKNALKQISPTTFQAFFGTKSQNFVWVSNNDFLILMANFMKNKLTIKTIGHRIKSTNTIKLTEYNKDLATVDINTFSQVIPYFGGKKYLAIECGNEQITLRKNKVGSISIRWNDHLLYNIVKQGGQYILKSLCLLGGTDIAKYENNGEKLTIYSAKPFEAILIFIIGFLIKLNMADLFDNLSNKVSDKKRDCQFYKNIFGK